MLGLFWECNFDYKILQNWDYYETISGITWDYAGNEKKTAKNNENIEDRIQNKYIHLQKMQWELGMAINAEFWHYTPYKIWEHPGNESLGMKKPAKND
jgi:hypothetical protein